MTQQTQIPEEQVLSLPDFSSIAPEDQAVPLPPRRPWWRRRGGIISIILVVLLILAAFLALFLVRGRQRPITYQKQQVTQGNFSLTVSATGPIQSAVYNLVFTGSGTIAKIDVSVGQSVVKGQVLAELNKTSLQDALNAAQATVLSAQTGVNNAEANLSKAEAQSNANLQSAQVQLNNAEASLVTTQTQSQASINSAQTTLSNDQTNLTNTQAQSSASIAAAQTTLQNDQISLTKTQAQSSASVSLAQTALNNAQTNLTHTQATANAQIAQALLAMNQACTPPTTPPSAACDTATAAYHTAVAQANASVATAQAQVNTAQQQLSQAQAQASASNASAQAAVNSAQKQLTLTESQSTSNNATAQAKISSDQQSLSSAEAQASSSNTTAQNAVNSASSSLATAQASAAASNTSLQGMLNSAQSTLQSALVGLQTAQHNLANATLLAPHAGIVTTINGTVGGTPGVSSSSTATSTGGGGGTFIQISDTSSLQVLAAVNESDTANLKVGEPAQFTVSAYGNRIFTGTVSAISPFGQTVSNVVTFPVTIDVNMSNLQNVNLLPGMTASVTIVVVQRPNVVLVAVNAINFARTATGTVNGIPPLITTSQASSALTQARQMLRQLLIQDPTVQQDNPIPAYVIEQPDGQTSFIAVPVVLGLTDDTYYVVLQGLSAGDIIVVGAQRG